MPWSSLPGSSVHGILQARILDELPFPSPGELPDPGIKTRSPALRGRFFTIWATREAMNMKHSILPRCHNFIVKWRIRLKELERYLSEWKEVILGFRSTGGLKVLREDSKFLLTRGSWCHLLTRLHARDYDIQKAEMSCLRKIKLTTFSFFFYHLSSLFH